MSSRKTTIWLAMLLLILPLLLAACGGADDVEDAAATVESVADDAADVVDEAAATVEAVADEAMDEADEAMDEVMDEVMDEGPCAPATDGPLAGVDPRGVEIVWWHNHTGSREELLLELVDRFNQTNECEVTVIAQNQGGYNDIRDKVNAGVAAGSVEASLIVGYQNDQAFYQLNGTLADFDTFINDPYWGLTDEARDDFYTSFLEQGIHASFDNQRLGFPPNRSMEMLFFNETWLNELGYDSAPTTPDEFREMACAGAAANGDGTGGYILRDDASGVAAWTYAFGGDVLSEDGLSYNYGGEATVEAMTFLKGLVDDGCAFFYTEGFPNPELAARRALFAQGSSSGIPFYLGDFAAVAEENGTEPDAVGVSAIPHTTPDPVQNLYGGDVMIIANSLEEQLAAWIFVKWYTEPENQADWVRASNYFPTRAGTEAFLGDYLEENALWADAAELLPYGYYEPQLISYQAVRDAASEAFNEIMQGADIQETLDNLTEFANELQAELMEELE